ncbi:Cytochrome P450 superfamily [Synechococcus sp. PCC 7335]|uniref:cytochrome P450 n=1 Tax=Synechococcus sp. (strain ATCC 29403 / PCC 7335) TaxID=91464 RepID=UPI00017EE378|nr:cytochrome P450 [Synechococcus sp. PCC 7335]EDX84680.1 Cytochrome P450 superfamily [Synechococcus sp. PCC 7335]
MQTLPRPVALPKLKQLTNWIARPYDYLDECAKTYGDTFTMHLFGFEPLVFLSDPQAIKEIFAADAKCFEAGRSQELLRPVVGDNSLLLLDGERHKRDRKLLMPSFHGAKVKAYADTICEIAGEISSSWQPNQQILASEVMPEITLEVILQTVFGLREGDRYQQLKTLLVRWLDLTGSPLSSSMLFFRWFQQDWGSWSPWGKMVRLKRQVYDLLQSEIDDRRAQIAAENESESGDDVLGLMLLARDEDGQPMQDIELKDELVTMLFAGHETTAIALTWAMYWIHKLPDVKAKLMAELDSLGEDADSMAIASLPYLSAVASETLRIYPIAPIAAPRIATEEVTINGHTFPPNTYLAPAIYSVHHRPDLYPNPKEFKPERFLNRQFSSSEFIPFGGGARRCLGYALAKLEINLVLATLLTQHAFKLANDDPVTPRRRGVVLATSDGVPLAIQS